MVPIEPFFSYVSYRECRAIALVGAHTSPAKESEDRQQDDGA